MPAGLKAPPLHRPRVVADLLTAPTLEFREAGSGPLKGRSSVKVGLEQGSWSPEGSCVPAHFLSGGQDYTSFQGTVSIFIRFSTGAPLLLLLDLGPGLGHVFGPAPAVSSCCGRLGERPNSGTPKHP